MTARVLHNGRCGPNAAEWELGPVVIITHTGGFLPTGIMLGVEASPTRALLRARELAGPEVTACPQCYPTGGRAG